MKDTFKAVCEGEDVAVGMVDGVLVRESVGDGVLVGSDEGEEEIIIVLGDMVVLCAGAVVPGVKGLGVEGFIGATACWHPTSDMSERMSKNTTRYFENFMVSLPKIDNRLVTHLTLIHNPVSMVDNASNKNILEVLCLNRAMDTKNNDPIN